MENTNKIPAPLESATKGGIVTYSHCVFDATIGSFQNQINYEFNRDIENIKQQISTLGGVAVTEYTAAEITMGPDNIGVWVNPISNLTINLIPPEDVHKAAIYTCIITASDTPNVVFHVPSGNVLVSPTDFYIEPSCINEIQIMYAAGKFYMRNINYK